MEGGKDDLKKGTQLLEIYALEIQIYTQQKNNKKLKACLVLPVAPAVAVLTQGQLAKSCATTGHTGSAIS